MNQQPIKLILTDLDGTLVAPGSDVVPLEVADCIKNIELLGVHVSAVTGRPYKMAQPVLKAAGIAYPSIFHGGAMIANPMTGEVLWEKRVPTASARKAVKLLAPKAQEIDFGTGHLPAATVTESMVTDDVLLIWAPVPIADADSIVHELNQIDDIVAHSNPGPGGNFNLSGIHVTHLEADKYHATKTLLNMQSVTKKETLAIADGDNDIPLFNHAGLKIAVANATDIVKELSDHIVASVYDQGFCEAVDRFVLPGKKHHNAKGA